MVSRDEAGCSVVGKTKKLPRGMSRRVSGDPQTF